MNFSLNEVFIYDIVELVKLMIINNFQKLNQHLRSQVIGQPELVEQLLIALLADGHILVEGPPGLAKHEQLRCYQIVLKANFTVSNLHQTYYLLI